MLAGSLPQCISCLNAAIQAECLKTVMCIAAGSALTTFNKGSDNLQPKVIALRSMQYTSGEMLYNPNAYEAFKSKVKLNDKVSIQTAALKGFQMRTLGPVPQSHPCLSHRLGLCRHSTAPSSDQTVGAAESEFLL